MSGFGAVFDAFARFRCSSLPFGGVGRGGGVEMSWERALPAYVGIHDEYYIKGKVLPTISKW